MLNKGGTRQAGITCLAGGLLFLLNYAAFNLLVGRLELLFEPAMAALVKSVFWCVFSLCLVAGSFALLTLNASRARWQNALGVICTIITLLGVVAYVIGSIYVVIFVTEHCADFLRHTVHPY